MSGWKLVAGDSNGSDFQHPNGNRALFDHVEGTVSDGYHTFDELYRHRALLTAVLFQQLAKQDRYDVHKALLHADGTRLDGYFVVMAELPTGQISYHYPNNDWNRFPIPARERANSWDGHTADDVLKRLEQFLFVA